MTDAQTFVLVEELATVLNRASRENESNTPDFILAEYLVLCLEAFERTSRRREEWYGKELSIGGIRSRGPASPAPATQLATDPDGGVRTLMVEEPAPEQWRLHVNDKPTDVVVPGPVVESPFAAAWCAYCGAPLKSGVRHDCAPTEPSDPAPDALLEAAREVVKAYDIEPRWHGDVPGELWIALDALAAAVARRGE